MAKKERVSTSDTSGLTSKPFAELAGTMGPEGPREEKASFQHAPARSSDALVPARRTIIRYQRKGRGGKEVSVIELRGLAQDDLERWLDALKKALGCGGFIEDGCVVVSGDQRERVRQVLAARGITDVTVS